MADDFLAIYDPTCLEYVGASKVSEPYGSSACYRDSFTICQYYASPSTPRSF
jgi:hypothetical protein